MTPMSVLDWSCTFCSVILMGGLTWRVFIECVIEPLNEKTRTDRSPR